VVLPYGIIFKYIARLPNRDLKICAYKIPVFWKNEKKRKVGIAQICKRIIIKSF
jgi:hypothetical protein